MNAKQIAGIENTENPVRNFTFVQPSCALLFLKG